MKTAVYSVKDFEKPFLDDFGKNGHELRLIEEPLGEENAEKARDCKAVGAERTTVEGLSKTHPIKSA